jgi:peptidoglycan hydrolase CwlO-like protein
MNPPGPPTLVTTFLTNPNPNPFDNLGRDLNKNFTNLQIYTHNTQNDVNWLKHALEGLEKHLIESNERIDKLNEKIQEQENLINQLDRNIFGSLKK